MKILRLTLCALLALSLSRANGQAAKIDARQQMKLTNQVIGDVRSFCYFLSGLASSNTTKKQKAGLKESLDSLFINDARIDVKSVAHPNNVGRHPVKEYLTMVSRYSDRFQFVALKFSKVSVDMKNLRDTIVDGKRAYCCNYSYWQAFIAANHDVEESVNAEKPYYTEVEYKNAGSDETQKFGKVYIFRHRNATNGIDYEVLLGDITAGEIRRL